MNISLRFTGLVVLSLGVAAALFSVTFQPAGAQEPRGSGEHSVVQAGEPEVHRFNPPGGWFPLPPELKALCGTLLECKPCGWAPECPGDQARDSFTALTVDGTAVGGVAGVDDTSWWAGWDFFKKPPFWDGVHHGENDPNGPIGPHRLADEF